MINAYKRFWRNYINFSGNTNRPDYWLAWLMNAIIYLIAIVILVAFIPISALQGSYHGVSDGMDFYFQSSGVFLPAMCLIIIIYSVAIIIPSLSISIRRLQDAGFHWAFIFLDLIPSIGSILVLILHCLPTNAVKNKVLKKASQADPDELERWYQLKEKNVITQDEYDAKKKELL
ncbi:DUF805 domain-containing protein [Lactiplantibacillus plantarum]|uniref:DUF805 domain-containing protein n=1 Tax=Lactiplantibacillus plantarum TaxID=1590 RepID=UPI001BAA342C|nr:DUF805 domain-containing protein [Lactiplantibacillus plantarum]MBS0937762.1 DUF805 domain-containing protein [Lactiplantibacillus plantarum]MBS0945816.1 DUF805 domain-containing protein [Lactiplantibacillus plantarum]